MTKQVKETTIEIVPIQMGCLTCHIIGDTPMIMHRFSQKARQELLLPKGRPNSAEKQISLKHDPLNEYRESLYLNRDESEPALFHLPANAFSKGMAEAALRMPGANKTEILQLVSVSSRQINLFGIPRLSMEMVRNSDMKKTPDLRTRAAFPEWACKIEVSFVSSLLKQNQIANLLAAAGIIMGVGDWRPQKGGGYGKYHIVDEDDVDYLRIVKQQGRKQQLEAYQDPVAFDFETERLFAWFNAEVVRREKVVPSSAKIATPASIMGKADKAVAAVAAAAAKAKNGKGRRKEEAR